MFRFTEPSSDQIQTQYGTFSQCTHYGIPYCLQNCTDIKGHVLFYYPMYFIHIYIYTYILNTSANRIKHDL